MFKPHILWIPINIFVRSFLFPLFSHFLIRSVSIRLAFFRNRWVREWAFVMENATKDNGATHPSKRWKMEYYHHQQQQPQPQQQQQQQQNNAMGDIVF